jgi:uncharacterized protein with PIN domain
VLICAYCNRALRPKKNGTSFVELAQDRPYKLWMADLWECQDCGAQILYTNALQKPVAESFQDDFDKKMADYAPEYHAKEWNR